MCIRLSWFKLEGILIVHTANFHLQVHEWARERLPSQAVHEYCRIATAILCWSIDCSMTRPAANDRKATLPHIDKCLSFKDHDFLDNGSFWWERFAAVAHLANAYHIGGRVDDAMDLWRRACSHPGIRPHGSDTALVGTEVVDWLAKVGSFNEAFEMRMALSGRAEKKVSRFNLGRSLVSF